MRGQYSSAMEHAVPEQFWVDKSPCWYTAVAQAGRRQRRVRAGSGRVTEAACEMPAVTKGSAYAGSVEECGLSAVCRLLTLATAPAPRGKEEPPDTSPAKMA
jgi:hypothetical protein